MQPNWPLSDSEIMRNIHLNCHFRIEASKEKMRFHLDSLLMTRMRAPFSSLSLWLSDLSSVKTWKKYEGKKKISKTQSFWKVNSVVSEHALWYLIMQWRVNLTFFALQCEKWQRMKSNEQNREDEFSLSRPSFSWGSMTNNSHSFCQSAVNKWLSSTHAKTIYYNHCLMKNTCHQCAQNLLANLLSFPIMFSVSILMVSKPKCRFPTLWQCAAANAAFKI